MKRQTVVSGLGHISKEWKKSMSNLHKDSTSASRSERARKWQRALARPIEALESRVMLTISTAPWVDPYLEPGARWSLQVSDPSGDNPPVTFNYVDNGPTTYQGNAAVEVDISFDTDKGAGSSVLYFGKDAAGDFITYEDKLTGPTASTDDVYSPYSTTLPAELTAGVAVAGSPDTDTTTLVNSSGTTTSSDVETDSFTLASETPTTITVPAGTYQAYELTDTTTDSDASDGSTSTPSSDDEFFAPGVGIVKATDSNSGGTVTQLTSFNGPADHLAFPPAQIATTPAGKPLPPVLVSVLDANNNPDTDASGSVTLTLASASRLGVSPGTLGGTDTVSIVNGVATFDDLTVSASGTYQLTATDTNNDPSAMTGKFKIGEGLSIIAGPTDTGEDDKISPAIKVGILDATGNIDKTSTQAITVALVPAGSGTSTATLSGTTTVNAVAGVATFKDLSVNKAGQYTLNFSDAAVDSANSNAFTVVGDTLVFKGKIGNGTPANAINPGVLVELVDKKNHLITNVSTVVTLSIAGSNSANPITGNVVTLVNGKAIFSNLQFGKPGSYTLTAADDQGDSSMPSNLFSIGLHIVLKMQPAQVGVGEPLKYKVEVEDDRGRLVNTSTLGVDLGLNIVSGGTNAALSNTADIFTFGTANNKAASPLIAINAPGAYTITFTAISENVDGFDYSIDPITSTAFKVVANHLAFVKEPAASYVNLALHYEIDLEDFKDKLVSSNDLLTLALTPVTSGASGALTASTDALFNGRAENTGPVPIAINDDGSYTLTATDVPATPGDPVAAAVTSKMFKIKPVKTS